jgi:hypothetical protein
MTTPPRPDDLILTPAQAVPPPEHPRREPPRQDKDSGTAGLDPALLDEIRRLAARVGGLQRLKDVVEALILLRC